MTLAILGTGGHAKSIYDIVKNRKKIYFFDKKKKILNFNEKKFVVRSSEELINYNKKDLLNVIVAIGNNEIRKKNYNKLKKNKFNFMTLIHPKSYSAYGSKVGEGTVILQGSLINTDTIIGNNCIINTNASIDHDCVVNDHTHICPGVTIAGNVTIGKNCWIGLGSKIIQNCIIGDNVFVAAGAVVTRNIKSNSMVKGIPAKYENKSLA